MVDGSRSRLPAAIQRVDRTDRAYDPSRRADRLSQGVYGNDSHGAFQHDARHAPGAFGFGPRGRAKPDTAAIEGARTRNLVAVDRDWVKLAPNPDLYAVHHAALVAKRKADASDYFDALEIKSRRGVKRETAGFGRKPAGAADCVKFLSTGLYLCYKYRTRIREGEASQLASSSEEPNLAWRPTAVFLPRERGQQKRLSPLIV